jgi:hypothetical protein
MTDNGLCQETIEPLTIVQEGYLIKRGMNYYFLIFIPFHIKLFPGMVNDYARVYTKCTLSYLYYYESAESNVCLGKIFISTMDFHSDPDARLLQWTCKNHSKVFSFFTLSATDFFTWRVR